jgi:predicted HD phosphohydrolase
MYYYAHHCGGDQNSRDMYRDHAWYQDAVDFCHNYDQNCFDPEYDSEPLEFFEPILRRVMARPSFEDSEQMARYGNSQSNANL